MNRFWLWHGRFCRICGTSWKVCVKFIPRFMKTGWVCLHRERERRTWHSDTDSKQTEQGLQHLEAVAGWRCIFTYLIYYNDCTWWVYKWVFIPQTTCIVYIFEISVHIINFCCTSHFLLTELQTILHFSKSFVLLSCTTFMVTASVNHNFHKAESREHLTVPDAC